MRRAAEEKWIQLSARGEVALARWQLAASLGLLHWSEAGDDADALARELHPLGPAWLDLLSTWNPD